MRKHAGSMRLLLFALLCTVAHAGLGAQSVQPVIAEFDRSSESYFQVTNDSPAAQIVTLEPRSFTLNPEGEGTFQPLDRSIHLELSTTSLRLESRQSARVFYKVSADQLPAWFCIYASFSPLKEGKGVNLRIMLPHTVYLYQSRPLQKEHVEVTAVRYDPVASTITATLTNLGKFAGRVTEVESSGPRASQLEGGFPVLPHSTRNITIKWNAQRPPDTLAFHFAQFQIKVPIAALPE